MMPEICILVFPEILAFNIKLWISLVIGEDHQISHGNRLFIVIFWAPYWTQGSPEMIWWWRPVCFSSAGKWTHQRNRSKQSKTDALPWAYQRSTRPHWPTPAAGRCLHAVGQLHRGVLWFHLVTSRSLRESIKRSSTNNYSIQRPSQDINYKRCEHEVHAYEQN